MLPYRTFLQGDPTRLLTKVDLQYSSYIDMQMDETNKKAAATFEHFQPAQAGPVGASVAQLNPRTVASIQL